MVSVIIPNYNHARYIRQRIESVLSQTWQELEIIILDDCSSDNSRDIIETFRDNEKVSTILYNEVNSGNTFVQWVKGIEFCRFEFVWIAESDDWCEPSFLENIMKGMMNDEQCVVGYCQSFCIQDANVVKWKSTHSQLDDHVNGTEFIKQFMLQDTAIFNASMAVWRKAAFKGVSDEFTKYRYCGDWLFWIELCTRGNVYISGRILNYFRQHDTNTSGNATRLGDNFVEELTMFHLLYKRKVISYHDLLLSLKKQYIHYNAVAINFPSNEQKKIKQLFFSEPGARLFLKNFYRRFYFDYAVRKILRKIIARY